MEYRDPELPTKEAKENFVKDMRKAQEDIATDPDLENRFGYHPANTDEKRQAHEDARSICKNVAYFIRVNMPPGREQSLALTNLEQVMFWLNAGIARDNRGEVKKD